MKAFLYAIIFALVAASASAIVDVTYRFNQNDVTVEAYNCLDSTCTNVAPFSGSFPNGQTTTNGVLTVRFPSTLVGNGYGLYYFSRETIPKGYYATWHSFGDPRVFTTNLNINFDKVQNCKAVIDEFTVINDVQANVPLVINMSASLDATTHSAFALTTAPVKYIPPAYRNEYFSADTRVTLRIYDGNDNIVNQQTLDYTNANGNPIFADDSVRSEFTWVPTITGRYRAVVSTEVIDDQCVSAQQMSGEKAFNVLPGMPRNECYTLLNNLRMDATTPVQGQTITAFFDKISNHANNYAFNDASYQLTPIQSQTTYTVRDQSNNVIFTQIANLAANPDNYNPQTFSFSWAAVSAGMHSVTVTAAGNSALCNGLSNPSETVTTSVYVSQPPMFTVTFQAIDTMTGLPIVGATVTTNGVSGQTNSNGLVTLGPFAPGTYNYQITHPGYYNTQGSFTLIDMNLELFAVMTPRQDYNGVSVSVTVLDNQDGMPIENALVELYGLSAMTDETGVTVFNNMAAAQYPLRVTAPGYQQSNQVVTVQDQDMALTVRLNRNGASFLMNATVQVNDSITRLALPDANVTIGGIMAVTGGSGRASLNSFAPGTYAISISHAGYFTTFGTVTFTTSNLALQVMLDPRFNGQRSVTVLVLDDATSNPIYNAKVLVDGGQTYSGADGIARLNNFVDGNYPLQVEAADYDIYRSTVNIAGQDVFVTVRMTRSAGQDDGLEANIMVSRISIHDAFDRHAGEQVPVYFTVRNTGEKNLENVKVAVNIQDFAARSSFGPFDFKIDDSKNAMILVDLPEDVEPGLYPVRITVYSLDRQRVIYRDLEIME